MPADVAAHIAALMAAQVPQHPFPPAGTPAQIGSQRSVWPSFGTWPTVSSATPQFQSSGAAFQRQLNEPTGPSIAALVAARLAGKEAHPSTFYEDMMSFGMGGSPLAAARIGTVPGRERIASDIIRRGLRQPWFHGTLSRTSILPEALQPNKAAWPELNAWLKSRFDARNIMDEAVEKLRAMRGLDVKHWTEFTARDKELLHQLRDWFGERPGLLEASESKLLGTEGFRPELTGKHFNPRLGEPAGVSLTSDPFIAKNAFGDLLRVAVDIPPSSVGQWADPATRQLMQEGYRKIMEEVPLRPRGSPHQNLKFGESVFQAGGFGQSADIAAFNQRLSDYLLSQGMEALAYSPRRYHEFELRVLDPSRAIPIGPLEFDSPALKRYYFGREAAKSEPTPFWETSYPQTPEGLEAYRKYQRDHRIPVPSGRLAASERAYSEAPVKPSRLQHIYDPLESEIVAKYPKNTELETVGFEFEDAGLGDSNFDPVFDSIKWTDLPPPPQFPPHPPSPAIANAAVSAEISPMKSSPQGLSGYLLPIPEWLAAHKGSKTWQFIQHYYPSLFKEIGPPVSGGATPHWISKAKEAAKKVYAGPKFGPGSLLEDSLHDLDSISAYHSSHGWSE